jgi:hypothetical protein
MTRKPPSSTVVHSLAAKYLMEANRFKTDTESMTQLSDEFSGNGVAVLCVHAAIADAVAILAAGKKSKSGDHRDAAPFLASVIPIRTTADGPHRWPGPYQLKHGDLSLSQMSTRLAILLVSLLVYGCADQPRHKAADARVRKQVSEEVARICALPESERQTEIDRVHTEAGMVIICPRS